jgi:hypothetical protein
LSMLLFLTQTPFLAQTPSTHRYRPFIDPIDVHSYWFLMLIPLAFGVALVYKAVRVSDIQELPRQTLVLMVQIILGMIGLGAGFYLFVNVVLPRIVIPS